MSTFAVFGMTRDFALAEARKKVPVTRTATDGKGRKVSVDLSPAEWEEACQQYVQRLMDGERVCQLCKPFDAPQFAQEYIALLRRSGESRDLTVKARCPQVDGHGQPIRSKKTGSPMLHWKPWGAAA